MLCDDLEAKDGGRGGKEAQEERNIFLLIADSHCCTSETNITL